jgi:seryl-tRNA synthetase
MKEQSRETDKKFQELAESHKETERLMKEQSKETDKKFQETEKLVNELSKTLGGIGNSLGDITEGLLTTDLLERFQEMNLDFDDALHNITIRERGTKRKVAEIDWLLLNTTIALVGESKTQMTRGDVDKHILRMKKLSGQPNNLIGGKTLYSAMAGVKINNQTKEYAKNKGLYVLEPSGDTVKIEAPAHAAVW